MGARANVERAVRGSLGVLEAEDVGGYVGGEKGRSETFVDGGDEVEHYVSIGRREEGEIRFRTNHGSDG